MRGWQSRIARRPGGQRPHRPDTSPNPPEPNPGVPMRNKATGWVRREDAGVRVRSRQPLFLRFLVVGPPDLEQKGAKSRRDWFPRPHSPCGPLRPSVQDRSGGDLIRRSGSRAVSDPDVVRGQKRTDGGTICSTLFYGALGEVALPDGQPRTSNVQLRTLKNCPRLMFSVRRSSGSDRLGRSRTARRTLRIGDFALGIWVSPAARGTVTGKCPGDTL